MALPAALKVKAVECRKYLQQNWNVSWWCQEQRSWPGCYSGQGQEQELELNQAGPSYSHYRGPDPKSDIKVNKPLKFYLNWQDWSLLHD